MGRDFVIVMPPVLDCAYFDTVFLDCALLCCCCFIAWTNLRYNIWFLRWSGSVFWFADASTFDENVILTGQRHRAQRYHQEQIRYVCLCTFATNHITLRRPANEETNRVIMVLFQ